MYAMLSTYTEIQMNYLYSESRVFEIEIHPHIVT